MLRLLYMAQAYHPGSSASITTSGIVKGLANRGHSVELLVALPCIEKCLASCSLGCNDRGSITVRRVPFPSLTLFESHMSLRILAFSVSYFFIVLYGLWIVGKRRFDLVVTMYHTIHLAPFSALLISKFANVPLVVKCHDVVPTASRWGGLERVFNTFTSQLNSLALKRATKILALSSELVHVMRSVYDIPESRFIIVPNGVDTKMFECAGENQSVREKLGLQKKKVLLYMGSVEPPYRKDGVKFLMSVMPEVAAQVPNVTFVLVGSMSTVVRQDLAGLASSLGIENNMMFVETVPHEDMPSYISVADVCIGPLCSSLETYGSTPRKVLEYLSCGKPVVVSRGGVSSDMIENLRTGIVVNYGDRHELALRIIELLRDSAFARKIGHEARQHAASFYDENVVADKLNTEFQTLISRGSD